MDILDRLIQCKVTCIYRIRTLKRTICRAGMEAKIVEVRYKQNGHNGCYRSPHDRVVIVEFLVPKNGDYCADIENIYLDAGREGSECILYQCTEW